MDTYSLGVIYFEMFLWFKSGHERAIAFEFLKRKGAPPEDEDWKGDTTLLKQMISPLPSDRPSLDEILVFYT